MIERYNVMNMFFLAFFYMRHKNIGLYIHINIYTHTQMTRAPGIICSSDHDLESHSTPPFKERNAPLKT